MDGVNVNSLKIIAGAHRGVIHHSGYYLREGDNIDLPVPKEFEVSEVSESVAIADVWKGLEMTTMARYSIRSLSVEGEKILFIAPFEMSSATAIREMIENIRPLSDDGS